MGEAAKVFLLISNIASPSNGCVKINIRVCPFPILNFVMKLENKRTLHCFGAFSCLAMWNRNFKDFLSPFTGYINLTKQLYPPFLMRNR